MSIRSRLNPTAGAKKQRQTQPFLQVPDVLTDCTLRHGEFVGGAGEAAEPGSGLEGP
jgi:hypothetical protein